MEAIEHTPTPDTLASDRAVTHVHQIFLLFKDRFGQTIDLEIPQHFIKLASIADLQSWEHNVVKKEGCLEYNRYDIAFLCVQEHLKNQRSSLLFPDQQRQFIDALFPRLFSKGRQEYPRMIGELQTLAGACEEQTLNQELHQVREATNRIVHSRDIALKEGREIYHKSFVDAFHNPLLGYGAPWYYDMIKDTTPDSIEGVVAALSRRVPPN